MGLGVADRRGMVDSQNDRLRKSVKLSGIHGSHSGSLIAPSPWVGKGYRALG